MFYLYGGAGPRLLHSFPTRRSSDLGEVVAGDLRVVGRGKRRAGVVDEPAVVEDEQDAAGERGGAAVFHRVALVDDLKSTRLNARHASISDAVLCWPAETATGPVKGP